ncbi:MAG: PAS domain S-box protein [Proteobacteria bacterium]|nr:PAS domain S-box protein [Pseudomonadota bacterium]
MTALIVVLLVSGSGWTAWRTYHDAINDAETSTANLAVVLDEHLQRTLRVIEVTVEGLADTLRSEESTDRPDPDHIQPFLEERKRSAKELFNIFVIDADGGSVVDALGSRESVDLSERPYFKVHRQDPKSGIVISEPSTRLASRDRDVVVSHRLSKLDGSFAGVLGASVSADYFEDFYRSIDVGRQGAVALRMRSGAIVAKQPAAETLPKRMVKADSTIAAAVAAGRSIGSLDHVSRTDGVRRAVSFRAAAGSPFIVSVGRAYVDFLASWWSGLWRLGIVTAILVAVAAAACWWILRQMVTREKTDTVNRAAERAAVKAVRRSESRERRMRERLEMILSRMPLGCMVTDADFRYTYANSASEKIFGYTLEEMMRRSSLEMIVPVEERDAVEARRERLRRGAMDVHGVSNHARKDGGTITCEWHNTPLLDKDGSFEGIISLCQDITERRRSEVEIARSQRQERETRQRLETILAHTPLGCVVADAEFRYTYWNSAAERMFGYSSTEVMGLDPIGTIVPVEERDEAEARRARLRKGDMYIHGVSKRVRKDGSIFDCEWHNTPLMGVDGSYQGVVTLCQDITERRNTEAALRQSAKMEAVGQLTGGVAHDFNNLLTVIMANLELLELSFKDRPEENASFQAALGAALRGAELTNQLLTFSRRQKLEPRVAQINELVEGMTRLLQRTIGENIEISLTTAPDLWSVQVDPTQLETALTNLVVNARDAMPNGGKLVIETANAPLDEVYAAQHAEVTAGDYVALSVSDTGTGMPPEVVARVFEPFFTTKEVGKGTGLGMSMVFGFVKQSGGHVKIYSEVGHGTTIHLYLPRAAHTADATALPASAEMPAPAQNGEVILLVEDEESVRAIVVQNLLHLGYQVVDAMDGPSALELLDRSGRVDLLFTDMVMPGGMNGTELAARARQRRPGLKILFTSGYTEPALASQMLRIDGAAVLPKPYRIADLGRKVRDILDRA